MAMNVKILVLGVLAFGEASGYEIKKMIEEGRFSYMIDASFGSIYPALTQLHGEGLLSVRAEEQSGKPAKKVYCITSAGRSALTRALAVEPAWDKFKSEFLFQILLADFMDVPLLSQAIKTQIDHLEHDLSEIAKCAHDVDPASGHHFAQGYGRAVLQAGIAYLQQNGADFLARRNNALPAGHAGDNE